MINFRIILTLSLILSFIPATQAIGKMNVLEPGYRIKILAEDLSNPQDITTIQPGGGYGLNLFVTEYGKDQVTKITSTGTKTVFAENIDYAVAILFGKGEFGNFLYASESYSSNGNILKIHPNGTNEIFCSNIDSPLDMVWGTGGSFGNNLYVASANADKIVKVDLSGNQTDFTALLDRPSVLGFSPKESTFGDYLFFTNTDAGEVLRVDASGNTSEIVSGINRPIGIAFGQNTPFGDYLYISESGTGSILKIAADKTIETFANGFEKPVEIHFSQGGIFANDMLVVDSDGRKIVRISSLGAPAVSFTTLTADVGAAPFDFGFILNYPEGLSEFASFQFLYNSIDMTSALMDTFIEYISNLTDKSITVNIPELTLESGTHEIKIIIEDKSGRKGNANIVYYVE